MAKFKKIIPALCMLVVSAIMAVSTTYAWFSMNNTVKATGLEVTAKSNATYLLIGAADNATDKAQSDLTKEAAFVSGGTNTEKNDKNVYPAFYSDAATTLPGTSADGTTMTITANKWYTAQNTDPDAAANKVTSVTEIGDDDLAKYVCTYKVWLTLSADSEDLSKKVKITPAITSGEQGTSAVVTINGETLKLSTVNGDTGVVTQTAKTTANVVNFTATTSIEVVVQVYIDGTATNVTSKYINNPSNTLTGTLGLTFELVDA